MTEGESFADPVPGHPDYPWEPPLAGTEVEHLAGALDRLRTTFRWKADGLYAVGLSATIGASSLTLGGLLKHLAFVEDYTFTAKLRDESPGEVWSDFDFEVDDWPFVSAASDGLVVPRVEALRRVARGNGSPRPSRRAGSTCRPR